MHSMGSITTPCMQYPITWFSRTVKTYGALSHRILQFVKDELMTGLINLGMRSVSTVT